MPRTDVTGGDCCRRQWRDAADCGDVGRTLITPFLEPNGTIGRPLEVDASDVWDAIYEIAAAGCTRLMLPSDAPPVSTAQYHFCRLRDIGVPGMINEAMSRWRAWWMAGPPSRWQV